MRRYEACTLPELHKRLWKVFSEFIRLRDTDENGFGKCCTCGEIRHWRKADAGHWIKRNRLATKYDERNVHLQCKRCNGIGKGEEYLHAKHIVKLYGDDMPDILRSLSNRPRKFQRHELIYLIQMYKERVNEMRGDR